MACICLLYIYVASNFQKTTSYVGKIVFTDNWIQEILYWAVKLVHLIWGRAQMCATVTAVGKVRVSQTAANFFIS